MLRRNFIQLTLALSVALNTSNTLASDDFGIVEGVHYKAVPKPHPSQQKTVTEIFYYGCSHCYHLEPSIKAWLKTKPKNIKFEQVPAVLNNPNWIFMARVYYTAKNLGILKQFHSAYFDAIQRDRKPIFTLNALADFVAPMGVKKEDYVSMFKSFKVDQYVQKARQLTEDYGIEGVPAIIINGRYITDVPMATSRKKLWQVVNHLIQP